MRTPGVFGAYVSSGMTPNTLVPDRFTSLFTLTPAYQCFHLIEEKSSINYCGDDNERGASGFGKINNLSNLFRIWKKS